MAPGRRSLLGIQEGYRNRHGRWQKTSPETLAALTEILSTDDPAEEAVAVIRSGEPLEIERPALLVTEEGTETAVLDRLPPDLPCGYHRLIEQASGRAKRLIVSPGRCHLPADLREWGWALQLYAARSAKSWGIGDLGDLARVADWSASKGAGVALLNPLHAVNPGPHQQASPYFPSSRCFKNPLYLRIEDVPGASEAEGIEQAMAAGRGLNSAPKIDRDEVYRLKIGALESIWERSGRGAVLETRTDTDGDALHDFSVFMALYEHHRGPPSSWPSEHRHPRLPGVAAFARDHVGRVAFHRWVQSLIEAQLASASEQLRIVLDLAIGVDPNGADAWMWQDTLALGASIGAPPDQFNSKGQNWGVLGFSPAKLRSAAYEPFSATIRSCMGPRGGMRFDHVMGLWRLWLIPPGAEPSDGAYVAYRSADLLNILALESRRATAVVIGEDLGTVEPEVRTELSRRAMLSYKVMWFEEKKPESYPPDSLATVTNHDLPTVAGLWTGDDLEEQRSLGLEPDEAGTEAIAERLAERLGLDRGTAVEEVVRGAYNLLGAAPSALLTATLEDALEVSARPNQPGTTPEERSNWSLALPQPLETIESEPLAQDIAVALDRRPNNSADAPRFGTHPPS
ncbi:MAG: 4-alpha-glucanotransferase [Actinomycetota bacterium]|nr:4-alpha-glucanotransferase [Actinomycetota bacterium]